MKENNQGLTFWGALQIVLIVLRLCRVIKWKWYLVLFPIEISLGLALILLVITLLKRR